MLRVRYYIGLSDAEGNPLSADDIKRLHQAIDKFLEGATIYQAQGLWKGNREDTVIVETLVDTVNDVRLFETALYTWLVGTKQECILRTVDIVEVKFLNNYTGK